MASETKRRRWLPAPFSRRATIVWAVIVAVLLVAGAYFMYDRLANGLGMAGATNSGPWGLWVVVYIWFSGLAGGLYLLSALVYLLRIPRFAPVARMALGLSVVSLVVSMIFIGIDLGAIRHSLGTLLFFHWSSPLAWEIKAYMFFMVVAVAQFVLVLLNDKRAAEAAGEPSMESLRRRGNVTEQDAGVAVRPVQDLRERLRADYEDVAVDARLDELAGRRCCVGKPRAGSGKVKGTCLRCAEAVLQDAGRRRDRAVRRHRRDDDEVESLGFHAGILEGHAGRALCEVRCRLVLARHAALMDARALDDPLVTRVDHLLEVFIRDDLLRHVPACPYNTSAISFLRHASVYPPLQVYPGCERGHPPGHNHSPHRLHCRWTWRSTSHG